MILSIKKIIFNMKSDFNKYLNTLKIQKKRYRIHYWLEFKKKTKEIDLFFDVANQNKLIFLNGN